MLGHEKPRTRAGLAAQGHPELWLHTSEAHRFYARCSWETVEPKTSLDKDTVMRRSLVL